MNNKMYKNKGFTLIEVMIVVAILGILTAIAMPAYTQHIIKSKRTDAKVELLRIAQLQESYFVQNLSYAKDFTTNAGGLGLGTTIKSEQEEYTITMAPTPTACTGTSTTPCTGFTITATPGTGQSRDTECRNFTLSHTGAKGIGGTPTPTGTAANCWK